MDVALIIAGFIAIKKIIKYIKRLRIQYNEKFNKFLYK